MRTKASLSCMVLASLVACSAALGQTFPSKPVKLIVPFPPGGGTDILARPIAQKLTERWGQQVIVENRAGAGGNIGTEAAAKAPPDGYTMVLGTVGTHAINQSLYANLGYDAVRDFAAITMVANTPNILVVHPSLEVRSVKELVAMAKARPGQINYASPGNGTPPHLAAEIFKSMAGVSLTHVPYKGSGPAMTGLLGGQVQMMIANAPVVLPHIKSGKLRALASTSDKRPASLKEFPTIAESGLPGYEADTWYGMFTAAGTPKEIVDKLNADIVQVLKSKEIRELFAPQGADVVGDSPAEFSRKVQSEVEKWRRVIKSTGARVD